MKPPAHAVSVELEVPFHDVDGLRVVWHGHYLKYMELARTELLRAHRLDVQELIGLGHKLFVAESSCRHMYPLVYGSRFRVTAWFVEVENRLGIAYDFYDLDEGRRCAKGRTTLVTTTAEGALCWVTPEALRARLPDV